MLGLVDFQRTGPCAALQKWRPTISTTPRSQDLVLLTFPGMRTVLRKSIFVRLLHCCEDWLVVWKDVQSSFHWPVLSVHEEKAINNPAISYPLGMKYIIKSCVRYFCDLLLDADSR